jgi:outer membrane murein-binding lipoprotein Lpp
VSRTAVSHRRIDALRTETADLRVEVAKINTNLNWMKGIGRIVAGSAIGVIILIGSSVYRFGHVESDIATLQADVTQLKKVTAEQQAEFKARDDRFNRTLARIEKASPPAPKGSL